MKTDLNTSSEMGKLTSRDAITAGALGALCVVIRMVFMVIGGVAPIAWLGSHFIDAILIGPIFMFLVAKTRKKGAVLIVSTLTGMVFLVSSWMVTVTCIIGGIISEILLYQGQYRKKGYLVAGYIAFSYGFIGDFLPIWITRHSYLQGMIDGGMEQSYVDALNGLITGPMIVIVVVSILAGALIGSFIGMKMMKKHFVKAGMV